MRQKDRKHYRHQYYLKHRDQERENSKTYEQQHRTKRAIYRKKRRAEHRIFISQFLTACKYCGASDALYFHHRVPRQKLYKVSKMWGMTETRILMEIRKCEIVCKPCHAALHARFNGCEVVGD